MIIRNILKFIALSAVALLSGCSGFGIVEPGVAMGGDYPVSLSLTADPDTRLAVEGASISWDEEDKVGVTACASDGTTGSAELTVYSIDENNAGSATFTGFVSMNSEPEECIFTYPSKESALAVDFQNRQITAYYTNQSGKHEPYMYACADYDTEGIFAQMQHLGAMLELDVKMQGISQITFAGNSLERLSPVTFDMDTGEYHLSSELGLQLTVPVQTSGNTYISIPPVRLEKGFSLILTREDGSYMVKSYSSDGSLAGGYDFSEKIGHIIPILIDGEFEGFGVSSSYPSVEHATKDGLLCGTEVSFVMRKSGTSNKLIEEWGAKLIDSEGNEVRSVTFANGTPITGEVVMMDAHEGWPLLPEGTYTFAPYYKMYGQNKSLQSVSVTITDPGVSLTLSGTTSYDKFRSGDVSGANSHEPDLIKGVCLSTNVHPDIISAYSVTLNGESLGEGSVSYGSVVSADYGNIQKGLGSYYMKGSITVGDLSFMREKEVHITGLPLEVDFSQRDNTSWKKLGTAKYSDNRITFAYQSLSFSTVSSAIISPAFHVPDGQLIVSTSADVCCKDDVNLYVKPCPNNANSISNGSASIDAHKIGRLESLKSKGYIGCNADLTLTASNPSLMYSVDVPYLYNVALYKVKIQYAD